MMKLNRRMRLLALLLVSLMMLNGPILALEERNAPETEWGQIREAQSAEAPSENTSEAPDEVPEENPEAPDEVPEENPEAPDEAPEENPEVPDEEPEETPEEMVFPFTDVQEGRWFRPYVAYVYENGLMQGNSATIFSPDETTTRAMVVTVLYRMAGSPEAGTADFTDLDLRRWYVKPVAWAAENGIVMGYGDGTFGPDDPVTREQLVAFMYRFVMYMGGEPDQRSNLNAFSDRKDLSRYAVAPAKWAVAAGLLSGRTASTLEPKGEATRAELAAFLYKLVEHVLKDESVLHPETANVPVLIFHSITKEPENTSSITADEFASAMEMLHQGGYETVSYQQLIDYVDNGTPLPEKPVVITFDDGYEDNLENAYPILLQYGYCCEIAVIGCYVGRNEYEGSQIIPHFALEEVLALEPGVVSIQSHTMRMHMQVDRADLALGRHGVAKRSSETLEEYRSALRKDFSESYQQIAQVVEAPVALTYPYGIYTQEADEAAREMGYPISVTIQLGTNVITVGNRESLRLLNRIGIDGSTTLEEFEEMIQVDRDKGNFFGLSASKIDTGGLEYEN